MNDLFKLIKEEGNYREWLFVAENGMQIKCFIKRNTESLHLNGYVVISNKSKFYGIVSYDLNVNVHGGITYSEYDDNGNWIIGFDCSHFGDILPGILIDNFRYSADPELTELITSLFNHDKDEYRSMEYVIKECESLAEQISEYNLSEKRNNKLDKLI